jgi:hypothetical protein
MKKMIGTIAVIFILIFSVPALGATQRCGIEGCTREATVITSAAQLEQIPIGSRDCYVLANDIDLWQFPAFPMIKDFAGHFDGAGHVIKHLNIPGKADSNQHTSLGFFESLCDGAVVENLGIYDCTIQATQAQQDFAGALAGTVRYKSGEKIKIMNCYSTGTVNGKVAGGLIGSLNGDVDMTVGDTVLKNNYDVVVKNCYSSAKVNGSTASGGLVGLGTGGNLINCYSSSPNKALSLIGSAGPTPILSNCYSRKENGDSLSAQDFYKAINGDGNAFKQDSRKTYEELLNSGLPILAWQKPVCGIDVFMEWYVQGTPSDIVSVTMKDRINQSGKITFSVSGPASIPQTTENVSDTWSFLRFGNDATNGLNKAGTYKLVVKDTRGVAQSYTIVISKNGAVNVPSGSPGQKQTPAGSKDFKYKQYGEGIQITKYIGSATDVNIPDTIDGLPVVAIDDSVFDQEHQPKGGIKSVTMPDSITELGFGVFYGCKELKTVTLSRNLTVISNYSFFECENLTGILIPKGVTKIGDSSFRSCGSLKTVQLPDSVVELQSSAFDSCVKLETVILPSNLATISSRTFYGCSNLKNIKIPESVTTIDSVAFAGCRALKNANIPKNIVSIDGTTFDGTPLSSQVIYANNKTTLVSVPLSYTSFTIPGTVKKIAPSAFSKGNIKSITIPGSVEVIGKSAFAWCFELEKVTIPASIKEIGSAAFYRCKKLKSITLPNTTITYGDYIFGDGTPIQKAVIANNGKTLLYVPTNSTSFIVPEGVTEIKGGAFEACTKLQSVKLPNTLEIIGRGAFNTCLSLSSVTIPDSVVSIGNGAFQYCSKLKSVTLPKDLQIDPSVFSDCPLYKPEKGKN